METIFSKIIAREIPADIVYEDEVVLAFLDISPVNYGHTLVIPKEPFVNVFDAKPETLSHMMKIGQKIAQTLKVAGLADGVNLIMNNGAEAGQEVFHAHLHVVPRLDGDGAYQKPVHVSVVDEAYQETKERLKVALAK
jgi:histidine triad (HIT) family protein